MFRPRRKFRLPVLSRLTVAWLALGGGVVALWGGTQWLAVEKSRAQTHRAAAGPLERLARPSLPAAVKAPSQKPATGTASKNNDVFADMQTIISPTIDEETPPVVIAMSDDMPLTRLAIPAQDVVITIDGKPAQRQNETKGRPAIKDAPIAAPKKVLLAKSAHGLTPIAANGMRPSKVYAKPFETPPGYTPVALMVSGLGLNTALTERAIEELPSYVTLAFAPYAKNIETYTQMARAAGHEVVLELPMEPRRGNVQTLGPAVLHTDRHAAENLQRLSWLLARFQGYFAVTNYLGDKLIADKKALGPIMAALADAGVLFIDDTGGMRKHGMRGEWGEIDRLIDANLDGATAIKRDLTRLKAIAETKGGALGKAYLSADTIDEINSFAGSLEQEEFILAPASAILRLDTRQL